MSPRRASIGLALALALAAFALYARSLASGFVYDAEAQIKNNDYIHTPAHLADVLTLRVVSQDVLDGTRPVHLLFLMSDSLLWGRNPFGYHLTSNLLHAVNSALLFLLLVALGRAAAPGLPLGRIRAAAAVATLLFIVHPILTEPVAEVSYREDPLALMFTLGALFAATAFPAASLFRTLALGGVITGLIFLACASKETGFMAPLLLALYAAAFQRFRPRRPWAVLLLASFTAAGIFAWARFALPPETSAIFTSKPHYIGGSFGEMLKLQPRVWAFLLLQTAWPLHLSADYMPQNVAPLGLGRALVILIAFVGAQAFLAWKSRIALFGAALFWLGFATVSNFLPIYRPIADRFLYMPMTGIAALACAALLLLHSRRAFLAAASLLLVACAALAALTWQRQSVFANPRNLWTETLARSPYSWTAAGNLGYTLCDEGDYSGALEAFNKALNLMNGKDAGSWAGAALVFERTGRFSDAEAALSRAIALDPRYAQPHRLEEAYILPKQQATEMAAIAERCARSSP